MSQLTKAIRTLVPTLNRPGRPPKLSADVENLQAEIRRLEAELAESRRHVPPGHYYSPIHSIAEVQENHDAIFGPLPRTLPGIEMHEAAQLQLLDEFAHYVPEIEFPAKPKPPLRYYSENNWYPYSDAIFLYGMMRHFKPRRIIEVGSGFSSCAMLDTNELFFDNRIGCTFIEPEPERLLGALRPDDRKRIDLVTTPVQKVPVSAFQELERNDILLIDSSHVSKVNSDVNYLYFEVLPALKPGVLIHVHDIFYPFRYPEKWIYAGWAWNEAYLLRALLMYSQAFQIRMCNTLLYRFHADRIRALMPRALNGGGSIWIERL
jgi:predicted O-methyltransferase YrrM